MQIGGIIDISTKDIPGRPSMAIFTVGCNLQCRFCHNKHLLREDVGKDFTIKEIIEMVTSNSLINAVSISGGEPTLQKDVVELSQEFKKIGIYFSIDTNGTFPNIIKKLAKNINRVALDLKGPLNENRLRVITGTAFNPNKIIETFNFLNKQENIDFEIRTTYVEGLMEPEDIANIINYLKDHHFRGNFVLQQYQYSEGVGEEYKEKFQKPDHFTLTNILSPYKKLNLPFKIYLRDDIVGYSNINDLE